MSFRGIVRRTGIAYTHLAAATLHHTDIGPDGGRTHNTMTLWPSG